MADDDVMLVGEGDHPLVKIIVRHRRRGIVRIIDPEQFGLLGHIGWDGVQVRQEMIFFLQRQEIIFAAIEGGADMVDRITGTRNQDDIAGIDEGHRHVADAFFRAD